MRLVDADVIRGVFDPNTWQGEMMIAIVDNLPTVDTVPVKQGQWITGRTYYNMDGELVQEVHCSVCLTTKNDESKYCPDCGAKMD